MISLFGFSTRVYIKQTPQKQAAAKTGNLDKLKEFALAAFPQFDTTRVTFDAVTSQEHYLENSVPENPLEDGSMVHDHIGNLPKSLTLDAVISDTPIDPFDPTYGRIDSGKGRSKEVYERLEKFWEDGEPVTVVTGLKIYQNMLIKSIRSTKDNTGHKVSPRIELVQAQIAQNADRFSTSFVTLPEEGIEHGVSPTQAFGAVALVALTFG